MQQNLPRLILAGTNSGCGKTTVTCAVLQALVNRGLSVAAAKCGPDYIDPMFHSRIIEAKSSNLDPFFFDENTLRFLLAQNASGCDVTVIEGVMGYYDGLGLTSTRASTYELAQKTVSPVVLVVNARGAALSVLASVRGFLDFLPDDRHLRRHPQRLHRDDLRAARACAGRPPWRQGMRLSAESAGLRAEKPPSRPCDCGGGRRSARKNAAPRR